MRPYILILLLATVTDTFSQATFTTIYNIFQTKCANSCHTGGSPAGGLDLSGSETNVYNAIVEVTPDNAVAAANGDKLIDKGYPARSFLLRKVAHGLSADLELVTGEGSDEPNGQTKLPDQEIELIRQWVIQGAPQSGNVVNYQTLIDYYTQGGRPKIARPAPPPAGQGMQIHLGPIFWEGGEEVEYFKKYDPRVSQNLEVYKFDVFMNIESHHYILRKFQPGTSNNWSDGLLPFSFQAFDSDKDFVNAWQTDGEIELPVGTGYFWDQNTVLDLNYHMLNYHNEILPGEVYMNVYTRPRGQNTAEMKAELVPNLLIFIPANGQNTTISDDITRSGQTWNIWMLSTHTHKYGVDYDIFMRNSNGTKGTQLYEGFFDFDYTFNQGFYDWSHPPNRFFNPMHPVNMSNGLIHEATYNNTGSNFVTWGFTTNEEMMLIYVQYTTQSVNYEPAVNVSGNNPACNSVDLSTDSGLSSYLWSNGETTRTITVTTSGTYTVTVTDGNGVTYTSDPLSVTVYNVDVDINNGNDPSICSGQSAILDAGSATSYLWSTGATSSSITVQNTGTYGVTITDGNGCTASDEAVVTASPGPNVSVADASICMGESILLDAGNAGASFQWSTGATTQTLNVTAAGNYSVTVTDGNGCASSDAVVITVNPLPALNLQDLTICAGSNATLDAENPGSTYLWSTGSTTQTITTGQSGTYSVTVVNSNGCESTDQSIVTIGSSLSVIIPDESICDGNSITLDAGFNGANYIWSTGATGQTINVNAAGTYSVTVQDGNGCTGSDQGTITVVPNPTADAGEDKIICVGESVELVASGGNSYVWSTGATTRTLNVSSAGNYEVTVTDGNGCTDIDDVNVQESVVNTGNIAGALDVLEGSTESYSVTGAAGSSYQWMVTNGAITSGQNTDNVEVNWGAQGIGQLIVTETNTDGCVGNAVTYQVNIGPTGIVSPSKAESITIYPNPFSSSTTILFPNEIQGYRISVYDITGQMVHFMPEVSGKQVVIRGDQFSKGIYFVEATGEKMFRGKIIVQ